MRRSLERSSRHYRVWIAVFFLCVQAVGSWAANLLRNPGMEEGDGLIASNWWYYGAAGRVTWANRKPGWGGWGNAFFAAGTTYGGFGQDIPVNPTQGRVFRFAISAKAEANYTNENTTIGMEFWAGTSLVYAITQNVYGLLSARREQWTYLILEHTNTAPSVTVVKVRCDFNDGRIPAGTESATCQWDDGRFWQIAERPLKHPARGKFEPVSGVYLGVLFERGGTSNEIVQFNQKAGKRHAVYAKFVLLGQEPFPWEWVNMVTSTCPGAGLHLILEPMVGFTNFYATNWGPGQATYQAALEFVTNCAAVKAPIFLRFAHEANGDWYPWHPAFSERYGIPDDVTPETYKQAFRNFAELVRAHAPNVALVWAPNQGNGPDPLPYYEDVYPGDEYVDWVGLSVYNGWSYGNSNEVLDFQFRNAIEQGYWQDNDDPYDDTFENFYWTFSDPNNPYGHQKPMMIAETAAAFEPKYHATNELLLAGFESMDGPQFSSLKPLAQFQSLYSDGTMLTSATVVDDFESAQAWNWGPWGNLFWSNSNVRVEGTNAVLMGGPPGAGGYVGGNGRSIATSNWSTNQVVELWVRSDTSTNPWPLLIVEVRNPLGTATVSRLVSWDVYAPLRISLSEFSTTPAFGWTNVNALVLHLVATSSVRPRNVWVDYWRRGNLTNATFVDQDWWPAGPLTSPWLDGSDTNGGWHTWDLVVDPYSGYPSNALRMAGFDANSNSYIGGNGFTMRPTDTNWSSFNALSLLARRGDMTNADPLLVVSLRDASGVRTAQVTIAVTTPQYALYRVPFSEFSATPGFEWRAVQHVVFEMLSGTPGRRPSDLLVKELSLGVVSNLYEQDWWPAGPGYQPWGDCTWTQVSGAAAGSWALRISGSVTNSDQWYIGGNGCSLSADRQNWSIRNALVLFAKRGDVPTRVQPRFKITVDNDFTDSNGNEAVVESKVANTDWYEMVIPFDDFIVGSGFTWTNAKVLKIELFTGEGGRQPNDLYLDHFRLATVTLTNGADNLRWKRDWIDQLYSLDNYTGSEYPKRVSIFERFPNLHMINWFYVKKFEDGFTKDFRIVEDGTNGIAFAHYYQRISHSYFLTNVLWDSTGTGVDDGWILRHFGTLNGFDPHADPDADGMSNGEEYVAGTDPTNAASRLTLEVEYMMSPTPGVKFAWQSGPMRHVYVESRTNLLHGTWVPWMAIASMSGSEVVFEYDLSVEQRFYRLKLLP